jgi:hypothetical protein
MDDDFGPRTEGCCAQGSELLGIEIERWSERHETRREDLGRRHSIGHVERMVAYPRKSVSGCARVAKGAERPHHQRVRREVAESLVDLLFARLANPRRRDRDPDPLVASSQRTQRGARFDEVQEVQNNPIGTRRCGCKRLNFGPAEDE